MTTETLLLLLGLLVGLRFGYALGLPTWPEHDKRSRMGDRRGRSAETRGGRRHTDHERRTSWGNEI